MSEKKLCQFPLFDRLGREACEELLTAGRARKSEWKAGAKIETRALYCVISGKIAVYSTDKGRPFLLRYLKAGDVFGAAALYSTAEKISRLVCECEVKTYALSHEAVDGLLVENADFMRAYIAFLSDRIAFLNGKINYIAAGSAERKLAAWLLTQGDNEVFSLPVSVSDLARILGLGRASLYRAFEGLQEKGFLLKEGTHVRILNKKALETEI